MDGTMLIVKAVHLGLNGSQTLSRILNSEVTNELFQAYKRDAFVPDKLTKLALSPIAIAHLLQDCFWPISMLIFSFLAFYADKFWLYVLCLFDVVFQFTFMNFLYTAVALNASKIWYTLVLAFLCFKIYLESNTYSSSENHSAENMSDTQSFLRLMPIKKSLSLNHKGELEPEAKLEEKLDALLAAVAKVNANNTKLGKSVVLLRRANARIELKVNEKTDA